MPCPFWRDPELCIATETEKAAIGIAAKALFVGGNGETHEAKDVLRRAANIGVAKLDIPQVDTTGF